MKSFPARIHAILAQDKPYGIVFRRGPSKSVCTVLWDRSTDAFSVGQWLKGRIYERRSDISPDGKYLIYFAMNGKWDSEIGGSWTAVSRAPWLKALDLYGKGDCWEGGGLFLSENTYWLNDRYFDPDKNTRQSREVHRDDTYVPSGEFGAECTGVYYRRLLRDGWRVTKNVGSRYDSATTFERSLPKGWMLRKTAHEQVGSPDGKGCYWDEHELVNEQSCTVLTYPNWEWAERDGNSIVWAESGCLYRADIQSQSKVGERTQLYDFNSMEFESIAAPY